MPHPIVTCRDNERGVVGVEQTIFPIEFDYGQGVACVVKICDIFQDRAIGTGFLYHILVLDKGCVSQYGTPEELRNQPGIYRQVYEAQTGLEGRAAV